MSAKPASPTEIDASIEAESDLVRLACPACHGELRLEDSRLLCVSCRRAYPVVDGIPVLIVERAETIAVEEMLRQPNILR